MNDELWYWLVLWLGVFAIEFLSRTERWLKTRRRG